MDEKLLRKKIGDKKFEEMKKHVEKLRAANKSPDEIAEEIRAKFPEVARQVLVEVFAMNWVATPSA